MTRRTAQTADIADAAITAVKLATVYHPADGWIPVTETWTYASASTFTVATDLTAKYVKGTRLKFTQTTVKYGVVVSSSYSAPNTTVTIAANTDYTIANAAISATYYSRLNNPPDYPNWFNYTPILTWTAGTAPSSFSIANYLFSIVGSTCNVQIVIVATAGATVTRCTISLPVDANPVNQHANGFIGVPTTANPTYSDLSTNVLRLYCTSVSASRLLASATYKF